MVQKETLAKHALIVGGSLTGLLAAHVLSAYFEQVSLVERDRLPDVPGPRNGLPQARHVHVLLWRGQQLLEEFFPGLQAELEQAGAPNVDWIGDARWYMFGGWAPRFRSPYLSHPCSRDLLEWVVRHRLQTAGRVEFLQSCEVDQYLTGPGGTRVTGVRVRHRDQPGSALQSLIADLVVDASGRGTHTPAALEDMGYPPVQETVVNAFLGYATRVFQAPIGARDWKSMLVRGTPPANKRGGVINAIENGRWMVTLAGGGGDYPPTDEPGFMEFARSLPVPELYDALQDAQPLTPISGYRKTENRWRHYERLPRWPENFIVLGDAVCAFNPVYGQGMTLAALEAHKLAECLRARYNQGDLQGWSESFQKTVAAQLQEAWLLATGDDYRYPETVGGKRSAWTRLVHAYTDRVLQVALRDPQTFTTFFEVLNLVRPLRAFFSPGLLAKVFL